MKASKVLLSSNCPYLWCSCGTRKSPRRYKPSHGKIFFKFEKSSRCGGLVQAKKPPEVRYHQPGGYGEKPILMSIHLWTWVITQIKTILNEPDLVQ